MNKLDSKSFGKLPPDDVLAMIAGIRESKEKGKEELALLDELANKAVDLRNKYHKPVSSSINRR